MSTASLKSQPEGEVGPEQFLLIGKTVPSHFGSQMCWMFAARGRVYHIFLTSAALRAAPLCPSGLWAKWPRDPQETPPSMSTIPLTGHSVGPQWSQEEGRCCLLSASSYLKGLQATAMRTGCEVAVGMLPWRYSHSESGGHMPGGDQRSSLPSNSELSCIRDRTKHLLRAAPCRRASYQRCANINNSCGALRLGNLCSPNPRSVPTLCLSPYVLMCALLCFGFYKKAVILSNTLAMQT